MCVYTCVSCSACQVLALPIRNVLLSLWISVLLCQAEVNDMYLIGLLSEPNEIIIWLNIAVNEILRVHIFNAVNHLICQHEHRLQGKLAIAEAEQILQGRAKKVNNHDIVVALDAIPMHI